MATIIPSAPLMVDLRDGNHLKVFSVTHTSGTTTDIPVEDSAVSCAVLMNDITAAATPVQETSTSAGITIRNQTSGASGLSFGNWVASDGLKQVTIHSDVASGTYLVAVRFVGSAAGVGSPNSLGL